MKSCFQKLYEKFAMAYWCKGRDLKVMAAKADGKWGLFLCRGDTPLAKLMPHSELKDWQPDYEKSVLIDAACKAFLEIDQRRKLEEFDEDGPSGMVEKFFGLANCDEFRDTDWDKN